MSDYPCCERCREAGIHKPSDVMYDTRICLDFPLSGSKCANLPRPVIGRRFLCFEHFDILPEDLRTQYVPVEVGTFFELAV